MLKEFREFVTRGNVLELAVGIVIGAAFGAVVSSFVNDILMPPIGLLLGRMDFNNLFVVLKEGVQPGPYTTPALAKAAGAVTMNYGAFVNQLVYFAIVAFAIFLVIKAYNRLRRSEPPAEPAPVEPSREELLLIEIRDALRARPTV